MLLCHSADARAVRRRGWTDRTVYWYHNSERLSKPRQVIVQGVVDNSAAGANVGDRTPVIAGIGLSDCPKAPHLDAFQHHALATQRVLEDCGVDKSQIDG